MRTTSDSTDPYHCADAAASMRTGSQFQPVFDRCKDLESGGFFLSSTTGVPQSIFVSRQGHHPQISGDAGIHAYLSGQQLFVCGAKGGNDALLVN